MKVKITKIHFPMVTAIKLESEGMEPRHYFHVPGEQTYPSGDTLVTEEDWKEALAEAKVKKARIEVYEV